MKVKINFDNSDLGGEFLMSKDLSQEGVEVEVENGFYWWYVDTMDDVSFLQEDLEELYKKAAGIVDHR
jgi:hypothetical protein